jgi:hypothetical protein
MGLLNRKKSLQEIAVVDIDPKKLMDTLDKKFGPDYDVHVRHSLHAY